MTNNTAEGADDIKNTEEYKSTMAVFQRGVRWVQFGIVCGIVGCITGVTALLIVILR